MSLSDLFSYRVWYIIRHIQLTCLILHQIYLITVSGKLLDMIGYRVRYVYTTERLSLLADVPTVRQTDCPAGTLSNTLFPRSLAISLFVKRPVLKLASGKRFGGLKIVTFTLSISKMTCPIGGRRFQTSHQQIFLGGIFVDFLNNVILLLSTQIVFGTIEATSKIE